MDHKSFIRALSKEDKERLTRRSDRAGLRHLAMHFGAILGLGAIIAFKVPFWGLLLLPQGILIAFLFTLQHEATHKTPFESETVNEWAGWLSGVLIFQPFLWFRYFHLAHHRHTQDPENDPELAGLPKPNDWRAFAWHIGCIAYWRDKAALLWRNAFGDLNASYLTPRTYSRVRREARRMMGIYALVLGLAIVAAPVLFWIWIVPLMLGFPILRIYLLAEHGRCPEVADMFDNTRTTYTNRIVRFVAWNMPYHTEHHVFPQVPFYQLPAFHDLIRQELKHTSDGYAEFLGDYAARLDR